MPVTEDRGLRFAEDIVVDLAQTTTPNTAEQAIVQWVNSLKVLHYFERRFIFPEEDQDENLRQRHRFFVTTTLARGEMILSLFSLDNEQSELVRANVQLLRDKLTVEFFDASPETEKQMMEALFGPSPVAERS